MRLTDVADRSALGTSDAIAVNATTPREKAQRRSQAGVRVDVDGLRIDGLERIIQ